MAKWEDVHDKSAIGFGVRGDFCAALCRLDCIRPRPKPGLPRRSVLAETIANNWILGQVGGMTVDAQDNIWVFQRPRSLTDDEKGAALDPPRSKCCVPAPSVLVFDQAGNIVKSWAGPATIRATIGRCRSTPFLSITKALSG